MNSEQIYNLRKKKLNLSQKAFGNLVRVTSKTISRWESKESSPNGSVRQRLQKLDIITDYEDTRREILKAIFLEMNGDEIDQLISKHYPECRKRKINEMLGQSEDKKEETAQNSN